MARRRTEIVDTRLAKALSHPLRASILAILNERVASPNEIAELLDARLPNVSYHVRTLQDLGCIELVRTAQRRGAIEHYYKALKRPFFSNRDWKRLPRSGRQVVSDLTLQLVWEDVSEAIKADTFEARADRYLVRSPLMLDEQGWNEVSAALARAFEEVERIASTSAKRLSKAERGAIATRLVLMHFESPSGDAQHAGTKSSAGAQSPPAASAKSGRTPRGRSGGRRGARHNSR